MTGIIFESLQYLELMVICGLLMLSGMTLILWGLVIRRALK